MKSHIIESVVGALVLLVAGAFFVLSYQSSQTIPQEGLGVVAHFDRVDGLSVGNDVRMSGVSVGKVSKIALDPETFQAKVHLKITKTLAIPEDSWAEISSESLMGGKYVALVPGGSEKTLQEGSTILKTQSSLSFESLLSKYLFSAGNGAQKNSASSS